ncbi:MAG: general stress protein CsbD [Lentimicrobium sp.]|nr:general stress protein CsbD [Lentimicrobium sp.]
MNELTTTDFWSELQAKLKIRYPQLTDADLEYQHTLEQDMLRMVEYKLGMTKKEMRKIIRLL